MDKQTLILLAGLALLTGCAGQEQRYSLEHDAPPSEAPQLANLENPVPQAEPLSRIGNTDYRVDGQPYQVWLGIEHYQETGTASWYGKKFHGHRTSNGELYDMYSLSAAHKQLPLPSYVRVTNLENGKQVIVRVNDRGPFHSKRIIDLSYAAAAKLGMLEAGTARVKLELISDDLAAPAEPQPAYHIQLAAIGDEQRARSLAASLEKTYQVPVQIEPKGKIFRLQMGPIDDRLKAEQLLKRARAQDFPQAFLLP